jgi:hypothetical protein
LNVGVTVIVATTGAVEALEAVKAVIFPVPDAASPIPGAEFVHVYVVVPTVFRVAKVVRAVRSPLQTT